MELNLYNTVMKLLRLIKEYLNEAKLMQLSTSINNQPWVCSVWFAADEDLNIYFFSSNTRRHSKEITKNNRVAGAMVIPQTPKDLPRGLQFQGKVKLLTKKQDIDKAISVYGGRIFPISQIKEFMEDDETPHHFYKIKPTQFVLFDSVNFPENSRQEYNLK